MWRPRDRSELVMWIGEVAQAIACHLLGHPLSRDDQDQIRRGGIGVCHCAARVVRG